MAPKVIGMAKAKAKAKGKAKAMAKAAAKAAPAAALAMMPAAGGPIPGAALHMFVGDVGPLGVRMHLYDALGDTTFIATSQAITDAFMVAPVTLVRPDLQITHTPPAPVGVMPLGGKGVGKGAGPWNPNGTWDMILNAELDAQGPRPTQIEVRMTQDAVQWRID